MKMNFRVEGNNEYMFRETKDAIRTSPLGILFDDIRIRSFRSVHHFVDSATDAGYPWKGYVNAPILANSIPLRDNEVEFLLLKRRLYGNNTGNRNFDLFGYGLNRVALVTYQSDGFLSAVLHETAHAVGIDDHCRKRKLRPCVMNASGNSMKFCDVHLEKIERIGRKDLALGIAKHYNDVPIFAKRF